MVRLIAGLTLLMIPVSVSSITYALSPANGGDVHGTNTIQNFVTCGTNFEFNATQGCATPSGSDSKVQSILKDVINIFSIVVGIVAVIMIIVGGFKYITSGGESSKVSGAQSTILYAVVGLVVVVLAQIIVHFVLNKTSGASSGASSIFLVKLF